MLGLDVDDEGKGHTCGLQLLDDWISRIKIMINRDNQEHSYLIVKGAEKL